MRILNGIAINYTFGDIVNYLNFQLKKPNLIDTKKIELDNFKIKNG